MPLVLLFYLGILSNYVSIKSIYGSVIGISIIYISIQTFSKVSIKLSHLKQDNQYLTSGLRIEITKGNNETISVISFRKNFVPIACSCPVCYLKSGR